MSITPNTLWNQNINTTIIKSNKKNSIKACKSNKNIYIYINWKFFILLRKYLLKLLSKYCHVFVISNDWVYTPIFLKEKEVINRVYNSIYGKWSKKQYRKLYC